MKIKSENEKRKRTVKVSENEIVHFHFSENE
jgi:hypothetical protein